MFENAKQICRSHYEQTLRDYGDSAKGVNWANTESQELRFQVLTEIADLEGRSIHDVGCGLAHLYDFLRARGIKCRYVGSDISDLMIAKTLERQPGVRVYAADLLDAEPARWMKADYVFASGLFHVRSSVDRTAWKSFVEAMIKRMFELAGKGIAFNMFTSYVDYEEETLFYQAPAETMDFCIKNLSRRVVIRHDYPLWEYTTYVYKDT